MSAATILGVALIWVATGAVIAPFLGRFLAGRCA